MQMVYFSKNDAKDFTKYLHGNKMCYLTYICLKYLNDNCHTLLPFDPYIT